MTEHPNLADPPDAALSEVKWRVDSRPFSGRARFLPYVDAYLVARKLDEWVGPAGWSDSYEPGHGKGLWCHLRIKFGDEWVSKTDIGVPSNMEAEKGLASDAFKRAGSLKWGVCGNVYRLPNVWAPVDVKKDRNGNDVAVPNDKTIPAIIAELKKQGFSDAAAGGATADHDEDATQQGAGADGSASGGDAATRGDGANGHDVGRSESEPAPDIAAMDKPALVEALTALGLPTNGRTDDLRKRLAEAPKVGPEERPDSSVSKAQQIAERKAREAREALPADQKVASAGGTE